jgi:hypothetical protein
VLQSAHSYGFPVRVGGAPSLSEPDIELIDALYHDADVARTLRTYRVPEMRMGGPLWERFPSPVPLTPVRGPQ